MRHQKVRPSHFKSCHIMFCSTPTTSQGSYTQLPPKHHLIGDYTFASSSNLDSVPYTEHLLCFFPSTRATRLGFNPHQRHRRPYLCTNIARGASTRFESTATPHLENGPTPRVLPRPRPTPEPKRSSDVCGLTAASQNGFLRW